MEARWIDLGIDGRNSFGLELCQLTCHLNPGWAATDDHDGESVGTHFRLTSDDFKAAEDRVTDPERLCPGIHRHGVFRGARNTKVIRRDAVADDQIVEVDPVPIVTDHLLLIMINVDDVGNPEAGTLMPG